MDSRLYRFIFPVNSAADIPDDFGPSVQDRMFEAGIFLPQDDANWFTKPPEYPARLLLLSERCLSIVPHPASGRRTTELNLDELVQLETGKILLIGWIQFSTRFATHRLDYNTRASRSVDKFIAFIRRRWLGEPQAINTTDAKTFGRKPGLKFRNLLHDALDRNEFVLSQCFNAPVECQGKFLIFRRVKWRPGHLVVLTSGNRVLWLKDEYRGRRERYAGIAVSAPLSLLRCSEVVKDSDHDQLIINFVSGICWRISILDADSQCAGFSQTLNGRFALEGLEDHGAMPIF